MKILTFSDSEIWDIFRLLASILHFGNIQLEAKEIATVDGCAIQNKGEVGKVATLLEVSLTCDLYLYFLRCAVHSSPQYFGEITNQSTNFKSSIFLFQVTKMCCVIQLR